MPPPVPSYAILVLSQISKAPRNVKLREIPLLAVNSESLPRLRQLAGPGSASSAEWLGLARLVEAAAPWSQLVVKLWDLSKRELVRDIQRSAHPHQSLLFKRAYSEGVGTFGGIPVALIVADFELTPDRNDFDLAASLQSVAAAAAAPALIGVAPDFPIDSPVWLSTCKHDESRYLFPVQPRWRSATHRDRGQPWLDAGYLIAARAAAALGTGDLADAAANLLPAWSSTQAGAFAATAGDVLWDVEFQPNGEASRPVDPHSGVNTLTPAALGRPEAFLSLTPALGCTRPAATDSLAQCLLSGRLRHTLQEHIRQHRSSDSGSAAARIVQSWFAERIPVNRAGEPLVQLRNVGIIPDKLRLGLAWHQAAGGAVEQAEIAMPGVFDDRVPTVR